MKTYQFDRKLSSTTSACDSRCFVFVSLASRERFYWRLRCFIVTSRQFKHRERSEDEARYDYPIVRVERETSPREQILLRKMLKACISFLIGFSLHLALYKNGCDIERKAKSKLKLFKIKHLDLNGFHETQKFMEINCETLTKKKPRAMWRDERRK